MSSPTLLPAALLSPAAASSAPPRRRPLNPKPCISCRRRSHLMDRGDHLTRRVGCHPLLHARRSANPSRRLTSWWAATRSLSPPPPPPPGSPSWPAACRGAPTSSIPRPPRRPSLSLPASQPPHYMSPPPSLPRPLADPRSVAALLRLRPYLSLAASPLPYLLRHRPSLSLAYCHLLHHLPDRTPTHRRRATRALIARRAAEVEEVKPGATGGGVCEEVEGWRSCARWRRSKEVAAVAEAVEAQHGGVVDIVFEEGGE